jgi:linoleoyl-CoA desaturase
MTVVEDAGVVAVEFAPPGPVQAELRTLADAHFAALRVPRRGGRALHLKAVLMVSWLVVSYLFLLLVASEPWMVGAGALSLVLAMAGVGFNVQHDGNHGSFSSSRRANRVAGLGIDVLGGSSYYWRWQHNVLHHRYTNISGADYDIDIGPVARLAPGQRWRPVHRFQHLYLWPLYGLVPLKWQWFGDYQQLATGKLGPVPVGRPRGGELAVFFGGKLLVFLLALGVPLLLHPWPVVVGTYVASMLALGVMVATVFSVAHSSDAAWHPELGPRDEVPEEWSAFQIRTTVGFAHGNRLLTWYLGGLNHQVEHHLFPRVAHTHYPALAPIVREVAGRHGIPYVAFPTFRAAVASHQRYLRAMGRPSAAAVPRVR